MGHPATKPDEIEERRSIVADLLINGWTAPRIARHMNMHHQTIYNDIEAIRNQWAKNQTHSYGEWVARELERIDYLESKLAHRIDTGDVAAINAAKGLQERRAKYLALDQPTHLIIEDELSAEIRELASQLGQLDNPIVREIVSGNQD
jgi:hypothetical protein